MYDSLIRVPQGRANVCEYRLAVERSETEGGFHHIGLPDVGDQREGARFFTDAVGHFPSFWELSLRKKPHASFGPDPRFYDTRMWDFFSHTRPQNRKVQPPAEVKECATVLAGVRSSPCPAIRTCEYVCHNS